jgi:hypothetical protein
MERLSRDAGLGKPTRLATVASGGCRRWQVVVVDVVVVVVVDLDGDGDLDLDDRALTRR